MVMLKATAIRSVEGEANRLAAMRTPEFRQKMSLLARERQSSPEYRKEQSERMKLALANPEVRKHISERTKMGWKAKKATGFIKRGSPKSEETREKIRQASLNQWSNPKTRKRILNATTSSEANEKRRQAILGRKCTPEHKEKVRQKALQQWRNPETRDRLIKSLLNMRSPNNLEIKVLDMLNSNFDNEWKFVGNGELIIGGFNPDFINANGRKLIIEFFGRPWHKPHEEKLRQKIFAQYGYRTLIIWSEELRDKSKLVARIDTWLKGN